MTASSSAPQQSLPLVQVQELDEVLVANEEGSTEPLRTFTLSSENGITVELCSVGASITKILLPKHVVEAQQQTNDNAGNQIQDKCRFDDIVLGYHSPIGLLKNPPYFSAIVGRVANRIGQGKFFINHQHYQLEVNNGPNHLHGGLKGFSHKNWDAKILLPNAVQFSLISHDGDEGYPGSIQVLATYSLLSRDACDGTEEAYTTTSKTILRLVMEASLLDTSPEALCTPINLAQHSYFNLAGHNHEHGILEHSLYMPSQAYTPKDAVTSIPTRQVQLLDDDPSMDWRERSGQQHQLHQENRLIRDGLVALAVQHEGLTEEQALADIEQRWVSHGHVAKSKQNGSEPYGFDHNYVVHNNTDSDLDVRHDGLNLVAILDHAPSRRRMTVHSNAPGVQVYTANYLDGSNSSLTSVSDDANDRFKDSAIYGQWQGICLETQYFPDSIIHQCDNNDGMTTTTSSSPVDHAEFYKGKCFLLQPGGEKYRHIVEYEFATTP